MGPGGTGNVSPRRRTGAALTGLALGCVALAAQPWRPMWCDEFLQFAFAAYADTREAWWVFKALVHGLNHGQTGAYIMADFWLLQAFGASRFWMRLPSYLAGILLFICALRVMTRWGLPAPWRAGGLLALFASPWLMSMLPNARPYMPLAGAVVATLDYYGTPLRDRRRIGIRLLGAAALLTGVLFHPFYSIYWAGLVVFTWAARGRDHGGRATAGGFIRHLDPVLALPAALLYAALGHNTWMHRQPVFHHDAWQYIGRPPAAIQSFVDAHFFVLGWLGWPFLAIALVALVAGLSSTRRRDLQWPALLFWGALAFSVAFAVLSWRREYPIFHRQWTASIALAVLAGTNLAWRVATRLPRPWGLAWAVLLGATVGWHAARAAYANGAEVLHAATARSGELATPPGPGFRARKQTMDEWVALANRNCDAGGPVWAVFREFYRFPPGQGPRDRRP